MIYQLPIKQPFYWYDQWVIDRSRSSKGLGLIYRCLGYFLGFEV